MGLTFIEVCACGGGLSTGLCRAGFEPLLLNEIDKTSCETLRLNHPGVRVDEGDMRDLSLADFREKDIDLLCGGVPCQSFSHAGGRKGLGDPRGQLVLEFKRLVEECLPKAFLVENVRGLLSSNNGDDFRRVMGLFSELPYDISHQILDAVDYGVPQKRKRVFIVGLRRDVGAGRFAFPEPVPEAERRVLGDVLTADIPDSPCMKYTEKKRRVLDLVPPGGCWVDLPEDVRAEYMGASLESGGGKRGVARRLAMDAPCLTLTTSPFQKQTERCHPLETRPLSVREYARIQTFPDSYTFKGSVAKMYAQIGNAVPVLLAYHMGLAVKRALGLAVQTS